MRLSTITCITSIVALGSAAPAKRDSSSFSLKASSPGNSVDNAYIYKVDSHLQVFSVGGDEGKVAALILKDDSTLVDQDNTGIYINPDTGDFGNVDPWGQQNPTDKFYFDSDELKNENYGLWKACPSGDNKFSLAVNECEGGIDLSLKTEFIETKQS